MRDYGQLATILAREVSGGLEVLCGAEYLQAAKLAGLQCVTVSVCRATDTQAIELAAAFDLQPRRKQTTLERSRAVSHMLRPVNRGGAGMSAAAVAARLGRSPGYIKRLARLIEFRGIVGERIASGKYSEAKACELVPLLGRLGALKAADIDCSTRPDVWATVSDWRRNCTIILELHAALRSELEPLSETVSASCRDSKPMVTEEVLEEIEERYWDRILNQLAERVPSKRTEDRRSLSYDNARVIIGSLACSRSDLDTLRQVVIHHLEDL